MLDLLSLHDSGKLALDVYCGMGDLVDVGFRHGRNVSRNKLSQPSVEIVQVLRLLVN